MTDFQLAVVVAGVIALVFGLMLFGQRRQAVTVPALAISAGGFTTEGQTKAGFDGINERFEALGQRMDKMETSHADTLHDVRNIRSAIQGLPSKDAVHRLEVELTKTAGKIETVEVVVNASKHSLQRIEDHLMSGGRS